MKFLVLSLCVCAVSAGLFDSGNLFLRNKNNKAKGATKVVATPAVTAAKIVATPAVTAARIVAPPAVTAAKIVATPAVTAAKIVAAPAITAEKIVSTPTAPPAKVATAPAIADAKVIAAPAVAAANTAAAVSDTERTAEVISDESDVRPDGYEYAYKTANGITAESSGTLKKVNESEVLITKGSYKYSAPDGTPVEVTYIADENGYQPQSNLLPVGPPIPKAILDALEYIATQPKWVDPSIKKNKEN